MVKIDFFIFGYRSIKVDAEKLNKLTTLLLKHSIPSEIRSDGSVVIRERDFLKFNKIIYGRIDFEASCPKGLYGRYIMMKHKGVCFFALVFSIIFLFIFSNVVWDVRISGNEKILDSEISLMLSECGLSIGDFWSNINRSSVENALLEKQDGIAWVNINRRGTVAYVSLIEKDASLDEKNKENDGFSNIIASSDCVIEEVTVKQGLAMVKRGDVVKKGDVLIMGVMPPEQGGSFCIAEGSVIGRIGDTFTSEVDRKHEKITECHKKIQKININIFKKTINIFKLYGNLTKECDIIEKEITFSLFGRARLPLSVRISYLPEYEIISERYTDDEMVRIASDRLNTITAARLKGCDLLKVKAYGGFSDDKYILKSDVVYLCDVGQTKKFEVKH